MKSPSKDPSIKQIEELMHHDPMRALLLLPAIHCPEQRRSLASSLASAEFRCRY